MTTPRKVNESIPSYEQSPAGVNADFKGAQAAIRRAAQRARQVAQQTGTDLIVIRAGRVVRLSQGKSDPAQ